MITLPGRPITKKAHNNTFCVPMTYEQSTRSKRRCGMRPVVNPSEQFKIYEVICLVNLSGCGEHYAGDVNLQARYWLPDKRSKPDLVGLLQATCDILQSANVVDNDRQIGSFDGSRIMGIDKANPRVELTITESRERTNQ